MRCVAHPLPEAFVPEAYEKAGGYPEPASRQFGVKGLREPEGYRRLWRLAGAGLYNPQHSTLTTGLTRTCT